VWGSGVVEHLAEISLNPVNPYHPISRLLNTDSARD